MFSFSLFSTMDEQHRKIVNFRIEQMSIGRELVENSKDLEKAQARIEKLVKKTDAARAKHSDLSLRKNRLWEKLEELEKEPPALLPDFDPKPLLLRETLYVHASNLKHETEQCGCTTFYYTGFDDRANGQGSEKVPISKKQHCKIHKQIN